MPTVQGTCKTAAGAALDGAEVLIELMPEGIVGFVAGSDYEVSAPAVLTTDASGNWSASLVANSLITIPTGTYYKVTENEKYTYYISVPNGAGPYRVEDILTAPFPPSVDDLAESIRDVMGIALQAGTGITITVNDAGDTITIAASGGGTDAETVRDIIGAALVAGAGISIVVDDPGDTITITATSSVDAEVIRDTIGTALVAGAGISIVVNDPADTITIAASGTPAATWTTRTTDFTVSNDWEYCEVTADRTATLPTAVGIGGKPYEITNSHLSTADVVLDGNGSQTINGLLTIRIPPGSTLKVRSNNANWQIV